MKATTILRLEKAARHNGGDKYSGNFNGDDIQFYIPQHISRSNNFGEPFKEVTITIETPEK